MRTESLQCPCCGALLSVREATDEDLIAMDPELAGMLGGVDHAEDPPPLQAQLVPGWGEQMPLDLSGGPTVTRNVLRFPACRRRT